LAYDKNGEERPEKVVVYFPDAWSAIRTAAKWNKKYSEKTPNVELPFTFKASSPVYVGVDRSIPGVGAKSSRQFMTESLAEAFSIFGFHRESVSKIIAYVKYRGYDPEFYLPQDFADRYRKSLERLRGSSPINERP
ncbi:MAG: hypothetical protein JWQ35_1308, partial [Bacteriovoracaceae bacterium]|nr:hypothetical protein [Bacteriovoracaceae bacterium]